MPSKVAVESALENVPSYVAELYYAFWKSLKIVSLFSLFSLIILYCAGQLNAASPLSFSKLFGGLGSFFASWATVFALGVPIQTFNGNTLPELVHPKIFMLLFIPGVLLTYLGQLW